MDVCDKVEVSSRDPSLDSSYYSSFVYTLMDGSGEERAFDSTPAKDPTGEVQVRTAVEVGTLLPFPIGVLFSSSTLIQKPCLRFGLFSDRF